MLKHVSAVLALIVSAQAGAISIDLGPATGYNLFIKENFSQPGADSQGKIAIGGNANIGQYDVGVNYEPGTKRDGLQFWTEPGKYSDVLVVGGNLTTTQWAWGNIKGNLVLGGQLTAGSSKNAVLGTTTKATPIDFNAAFDQFNLLSQALAGQSNTGGLEFKYNNWLMLDGSANNDVYFTSITGQMLANATDLTAPGLDKNDTLVINVSGKNINFDSLNYGRRESFAALDMSASHILYNFFEAENITFSGGIKGNILAPNANFTFLQGDLSGQVIAKSWTGGWGAQANLWDGFFVPPVDIPPPATPPQVSVPEPSAVLLLLAGLFALVLIRRKRA
ncbi:choice-of-anchor A family protein [Cellvibrio sp. OA-2007]|uniref:choice-of-anchor A family protein n=1 Tax=Cellvibrio sp. OA-2007 TaxID=529823 RepID=UPI0007825E8A|nr:choice-of-anchor A family protein [Cellvibrio sp. OA-2007]